VKKKRKKLKFISFAFSRMPCVGRQIAFPRSAEKLVALRLSISLRMFENEMRDRIRFLSFQPESERRSMGRKRRKGKANRLEEQKMYTLRNRAEVGRPLRSVVHFSISR